MRTVILGLFATSPALAGSVYYQGRLMDAFGDPLSGPHRFDVTLTDDAVGTTTLWSGSFVDFPVQDGYFALELGVTPPFAEGLFAAHADPWVRVTVDATEDLDPSPLGTVPFAHAAEQVTGSEITAGTAFTGRDVYRASPSTNVTFGQVWQTGVVPHGSSAGPINLNGLFVPTGSVGLLAILFSPEPPNTGNNSNRLYAWSHGQGHNDFTQLHSVSNTGWAITGSTSGLVFTNTSGVDARYTIKVLPMILHDAAHL